MILRVDEPTFNLVEYFLGSRLEGVPERLRHKYGVAIIDECGRRMEGMSRDLGCFSPSRPTISFGYTRNSIEKTLSSSLHQLILELTQACNLSCGYCVFSGRYPGERTHRQQQMIQDTAFRAIDFFLERSDNSAPEIPITFYGGEPLLNFSLLKNCVKYARQVGGFRCRPGFTTNGTLLNKDIAAFLIDQDVRVTLSIDGPRSIHDRWRRGPSGRGTYRRVRQNLDMIQRMNPDYFRRNISFNTVLAPPLQISKLRRFFYRSPEFRDLQDRMKFNFIFNPQESNMLQDRSFRRAEVRTKKSLMRAKRSYQRHLMNGTYDRLTIEKELFFFLYFPFYKRSQASIGSTFAPRGFCIPGQRRLYVDVHGTFFMCEKVGNHFSIGNVWRGFDLEKITNLFSKLEDLYRGCGCCWAVRFCSKCFNEIREGDDVSPAKVKATCRILLSSLESNLISYCSILEKNPNAFKHFDSVVIT